MTWLCELPFLCIKLNASMNFLLASIAVSSIISSRGLQ